MNLRPIAKACKKNGPWFAFIIFYAMQVVVGVGAYWIQRLWLEAANPAAGGSEISAMILHHQVMSFVLCTSIELWTNDEWTTMEPLSKTLSLIGGSWLLWVI